MGLNQSSGVLSDDDVTKVKKVIRVTKIITKIITVGTRLTLRSMTMMTMTPVERQIVVTLRM